MSSKTSFVASMSSGPLIFWKKKRYCCTLLKAMNETQRPRIRPDPWCLSQVETSWFGTAGNKTLKKTRRLWDRRLLSCNRCALILLKKVRNTHDVIHRHSLSRSLIFQRHQFIKKTSRCKVHWQLSLR